MADLGSVGKMVPQSVWRRFPERRGLESYSLAVITAIGVAGTLSGTVTNNAGTLVPGVRVNCYNDNGATDLVATAVTDSNGAYSITGLDTAYTYCVVARDPTNTFNAARADRVTPV
jgi:hypothetical protein